MRAALLLLAACGNVITANNPNAITPEEKKTLWTVQTVPLNDWFTIHGSDLNTLFIAGKAGRILRYDGKAIAEITSPTMENLYALYLCTPTLGYAVGAGGTILAWDGTQWSAETSNTTEELRGIWCDGKTALAVGANATALQRGKGGWAVVKTDSPDDLFAITKGNGAPFAVGTLGTIASFNGTSFTRSPLGGFPKTLVAATTGPGGTFIGGVDGAVFNRSNGQQVMGLQASFVRGITAPDKNTLFVAGWDGLLARVTGGKTILAYKDAGAVWLYGVWSASPADVWVVGASGTVLSGPPLVDPTP